MAATARSCPPSLSVHSPLLACVPLSTKETGVSVSFVESGTEGWKRKRDGKGEAREGAGGGGEVASDECDHRFRSSSIRSKDRPLSSQGAR